MQTPRLPLLKNKRPHQSLFCDAGAPKIQQSSYRTAKDKGKFLQIPGKLLRKVVSVVMFLAERTGILW